MGSVRLPGKVMAPVLGRPLLQLILERLERSARIADIVVATTQETGDEAIVRLCESLGVACYRGSSHDVRKRVLEAAVHVRADVIVQIGADQPFPDWNLNDQLVDIFAAGEHDFVSNALDLTYPLGIVAQVYATATLAETEKASRDEPDREGTSDYMWQHPEKYSIFNLKAPPELTAPHLRLTVDHSEDLDLATRIYESLYCDKPDFTTLDIIRLLQERPEWTAINGHLVHDNRIRWSK